jgi:hypothetical protein
MTSTYAPCSVELVMIKDTKNKKEDDSVKVRLNLDLNEYEITLRDQNSGSEISHRIEMSTKEKVMDYLYLVLKSICLDEDGYENIQVNTPLMPRVFFSVKSLKDLYYREHVHEILRTGLDLLEDTIRLPSKSSAELKNPVNPSTVNEYYMTPQRSAYSPPAGSPPAAPRRSARLSSAEQDDTNDQNDRYYSHMINNQRHNFFDHNA